MHLDTARAEAAVMTAGNQLGIDAVACAAAIVRVANSNMERAVRAVSVERGEDPRDFPLIAFGGGGGLHACEMAEELGIGTVIVPKLAGALSALGMLLADRTRDYSIGALGAKDFEARFRRMEKQAKKDVRGAQLERLADIRYEGQSYELTVPWVSADPAALFHKEHHHVYGYSDAARVTQVVTLRLRATLPVKKPSLRVSKGRSVAASQRRVWLEGRWRNIATGPREMVGAKAMRGPALVLDYGSTTLVPPSWSMRCDTAGNLVLSNSVR
jgi:N-methylhydantoinase A